MERAPSLPRTVKLPDPMHVVTALLAKGWSVEVFSSPEYGPMHNNPDLPDRVWLEALRDAGMSPLPCVACYSSGSGEECMAGRCAGRSPGGLFLPR